MSIKQVFASGHVTTALLFTAAAMLQGVVHHEGHQAQQPPQTGTAVSMTETALQLARYGTQEGNARHVLAAAQLLILVERSGGGIERVDGATASSVPWDGPGPFTATGLLSLASSIAVSTTDTMTAKMAASLAAHPELGVGDTTLAEGLGRAARALATTRGAVGGHRWIEGFLPTQEVAVFEIPFEGRGVPNQISITVSHPSGNLDCFLFDDGAPDDETRRPAQADDGEHPNCLLQWRQSVDGIIAVRLRNVGEPTFFVLMSN